MKTIEALREHSRPREKLQECGVAAPTDDEELVAAILGRGMVGLTCAPWRGRSRD